MSQHNPLLWKVTDPDRMEARIPELKRKNNELAQQLLLALQPQRTRPAVTPSQIQQVKGLIERFPNFQAYLRWIVQSLKLSQSCEMPVIIRPHLLLGPPGVGKSFIVRFVAEALGLAFDRMNVPDISSSWVLSGSSTTWVSSQPGFVAKSLRAGPVPWLIFDEIDKSSGRMQYPVQPTFLSMLESSTACEFRDECLELTFDIRPLVFTFTANRIDTLDPALRSRMAVFEITEPAAEDMPELVTSVDEVLRQEDPRIARVFAPLNSKCRRAFDPMAPRDIKHALTEGYQSALERHKGRKIQLRAAEIEQAIRRLPAHRPSPRGIGFNAEIG